METLYFDSLEDAQAYKDQLEGVSPANDGVLYFDSLEEAEAYKQQLLPQQQDIEPANIESDPLTPTDEPETDGFISATSKSLSNVPERMQQSVGGLVQMLGDDMESYRQRDMARQAAKIGMTPDDYQLIASAAQEGLIDPKMTPQQAKETLGKLKQSGYSGQFDLTVDPQEIAQTGQDITDDAQSTMVPVNAEEGSLAYYASSAIGSIAEMMPALAASIASRRVEPALAIMGGQVGGQSYDKAIREGASVEDAQRYALGSVAAEVIPSALPLGVVLQRGKSFISKLLGATVAEGAQEVITEAGNIGLDRGILNQDITWGEALTRLKDAGIIGTMAGGGMATVVQGADVAEQAYQSPERQFSRALDADVNASNLAPSTPIDHSISAQPASMLDMVNTNLASKGMPAIQDGSALLSALVESPQEAEPLNQVPADSVQIDQPGEASTVQDTVSPYEVEEQPALLSQTTEQTTDYQPDIDIDSTDLDADIDVVEDNSSQPPRDLMFKPSDTFNAPSETHVPTYESSTEGLPERQERITIEGREHKVPRVQRVEPIHHMLSKIIGRRTYYRHIKGKGVQGYYRPGQGVLRTKKKNDVEVLAHEMAHYLDMYSNRDGLPNFQNLYKSDRYRNEMIDMSYPGIDKNDTGLQMIEGFAEFVRLWLTNNQSAMSTAPKFYRAFNDALKSQPKLHKKMKKLRAMMHNYYYQGHLGRNEAGIGHYPSLAHQFDNWWYRRLSRMRQAAIDSDHAHYKAEMELKKKIGDVEASSWKQMRRAKAGYIEIAGHIMNKGTLDWDSKGGLSVVSGKSLREVLAPLNDVKLKPEHKKLAKDRVNLLMQYFKARRAVELHGQGRENQVNLGDAQKTVALDQEYPVFAEIFSDFQAFNKRMLDFYQGAGLISKESRAAIEEMNKDYVPFHRIREYLGGAKAPKGGLKRLTGGTANTEDILINIQDGIVENVRAALLNKAKQTLYKDIIQSSEDGAVYAAEIPARSELITVDQQEMSRKIRKVLADMGVDASVIDLSDGDLLQFWRHGMPPSVGDSGNLIDSVMIEGKTKYFEVKDPLLTESLQSMDPVTLGIVLRVMHGVRNLFTRTVTLGLEFMGANFVMDSTSGWTYTKNKGYIPVMHSLMGMYDYLKKNDNYWAFVRGGGGGTRLESITRQGSARRKVAIDEFGVMSIPDKILATIDKMGGASDYGTRIAEANLSRKAGKTESDAAFDGREISTDFNVIGGNEFLANFSRSIHFFNAAVQSMDRLYRELKTKPKAGNVANFVGRSLLGVMIPTVMLYMYNREDETYQEEPAHKRLKNWYIPIGKYKNGKTQYFLLPRPYDAGHLFGSLPEILVEKMFYDGNDDRAVHDFWWTLGNMFSLDVTPSIFMGMSDILFNEDWKGAPVIPDQYKDVEGKDQFTARTSETFYQLGQLTGMSPMQAEHMWSSSTGYLGGYLLHLMDNLLWDESKGGEKTATPWQSRAAVTRFITPEVRPYIRDTREFFDLKSEVEKVYKTFNMNLDFPRQMTGRSKAPGFVDDAMVSLSGPLMVGLTKEEKQVLYALHDSMNTLTDAYFGRNGMKTLELDIMYNQNLTAQQKRERINGLWLNRNEALKQAMKPIRQQLQKAKTIASKRLKAEGSK